MAPASAASHTPARAAISMLVERTPCCCVRLPLALRVGQGSFRGRVGRGGGGQKFDTPDWRSIQLACMLIEDANYPQIRMFQESEHLVVPSRWGMPSEMVKSI